eukprot:scaffold42965_cov75-Phaeocystis_antarctica.AAC.3
MRPSGSPRCCGGELERRPSSFITAHAEEPRTRSTLTCREKFEDCKRGVGKTTDSRDTKHERAVLAREAWHDAPIGSDRTNAAAGPARWPPSRGVHGQHGWLRHRWKRVATAGRGHARG